MATLRELRRRIASVKSTETITRAMRMVAAAKLRRAEEELVRARPYSDKILALAMELCSGLSKDAHPFITTPEEHRGTGVIVVTSDKGLCSSFNNNIILGVARDIAQFKRKTDNVALIAIGRKGYDYFLKQGAQITNKYFEERGRGDKEIAAAVAREATQKFVEGSVSEFYLYYTIFKGVARQEIKRELLLPIDPTDAVSEEAAPSDVIFEPSQNDILERILPKYIESKILRALLESHTSEHAARMTAMDVASSNCKEVIAELSLIYNKERQAAITNEILDIVGGAEALKK